MSSLDERYAKCRSKLSHALRNQPESKQFPPRLDLTWIPPIEEYLGKYLNNESSNPPENLISTIRSLLKVGMVIFGTIINITPAGLTIEVQDVLYCSTVADYNFYSGKRDFVSKTIQNVNKSERKSNRNDFENLGVINNGTNLCLLERLKYLFKQLNDQALLAFCSTKEFDGIIPDNFHKNQIVSDLIH